MKKITKFLLFLSIINLLSSCVYIRLIMPIEANYWNENELKKINEYSQIVTFIQDKTNNAILGTVEYGDFKYNIYEVYINNNAKKDVLIFSGVHGDEPGGVISSIALINNIEKIHGTKEFNFSIVPVVNPWGYEYFNRYNAKHIDINRDFSNEQTLSQEANIIIQHYKNIKPDIVIDLHESNYDGENYYFVYNKKMEKIMRNFIDQNEDKYKFENNMKYAIYKAKNGIINISEFVISFVRMADRCALSNYFLQKTRKVVVIESTTKNTLEERIYFQLNSIQHILLNANY